MANLEVSISFLRGSPVSQATHKTAKPTETQGSELRIHLESGMVIYNLNSVFSWIVTRIEDTDEQSPSGNSK